LKKGQPDLFVAKQGLAQLGRFVMADGSNVTEFSFSYSNAEKKLAFAIPQLQANKQMQLQIINKPIQQVNTAVDQNVSSVEREVSEPDDLETTVTTKDIEGKLDLGEVKVIYNLALRTSLYSSFTEKLNNVSVLGAYNANGGPLTLQRLYASLPLSELFDELEINGSASCKPLVNIEAQLSGSTWYNNRIYPLIYEGYPLMGTFTFKTRSVDELGIPPVKSIFFEETIALSQVTARKIAYALFEAAYSDLRDLKSQIADYAAQVGYYPSDRLRQIVVGYMPSYDPGDYPVRFRYTIPGINLQTSNVVKNVSWHVVRK
jgi:hypothetical protein